MRLRKITLGLALSVLSISSPAELTVSQLIYRLEQNFEQIKTYQAKFEQEVRSEQFGRSLSKGKGEVYYSKPGKMHWHYTEPEEHFYITDGKTLWDYLPSVKQVLEVPIDEALSSNLPKSFLFGMAKISEQFEVSFAPQEQQSKDSYRLVLVPKKEQDRIIFGGIELLVEAKTFLVKEVKLRDSLGNENLLRFSEIKVNPKIDERMFRFKAKEGVGVLRAPSINDALKENNGANKKQ